MKVSKVEREVSESAASMTSHLGKTDVLLSVSESSDPGHNRLFCCRGAEDVGFLVFMIVENSRQSRPTPTTESQQGARGPKYLAPSHGGYETVIAR